MARDRVFINGSFRSQIDSMKERDLLGFNMVENKDSFILATALGVDKPSAVRNRDGWFLMKNLKTTDKAILAAVLLGTATDDAEVDMFADLDKAISLCEECAETGFLELQRRIEEADYDRELFERRMLKELDMIYSINVDGELV